MAWRDWLANHIGLDDEQKLEVYTSVARSATLRDATYWAEIVFAAGIATMGLVLDSPAVIIGAMLISPLMGPIMAAGLAMAAGDFILAVRAVTNIAISCMVAVAFATLLVALLPFREMTAEIAARTNPNTLDLVVALFSGAVAALATSKSLRGVATSIPGVAIAVALMPPLCVTGYGLGVMIMVERAQGLEVLRGGALLFGTNLVAITFSSMLVFLLLHVDGEPVRTRVREWRKGEAESVATRRLLERMALPKEMARIGSLPARLVILATLIAAIFVPLARSFDAMSREVAQRNELNAIQRKATEEWQRRFATTAAGAPRSYIDVLEAKQSDGRTSLTMRVFTSRALTRVERKAYEQAVARALRRDPDALALTLVEVPTSQYELATRARSDTAPAAPPLAQQLDAARGRAVEALAATPLPPRSTLLDSAVTFRVHGIDAVLTYLAPTPFGADAQALIARDVQSRLGIPGARVVLRWVPQRIAVAFTGRATGIPDGSRPSLLALAQALAEHPELAVVVHTPGDSERAAARSAAVVETLRGAGVAPQRMSVAVAATAADPQSVDVTVARR